MSNYSELLKDPRWQVKRIAILKRDNFTCQECGARNTMLHVHHHFYTVDTNPWDYDDCMLITLCEECHINEEFLKNFDTLSYRYLLTIGFTRNKISKLIAALSQRLNVTEIPSDDIERLIDVVKPSNFRFLGHNGKKIH
jgi:5-methylcytosine-specific restriction endonuclease McrA